MIFKSSTSNSAAHEWAFQLPMWADQLPWLFSQLRLCVPMQAHKAAVREDMNGGAADMYWWCPTLYMCKPRSICQLANMLGHTRVLGSCVHTAVRSAAFWTLRTSARLRLGTSGAGLGDGIPRPASFLLA